MQCFRCSETTFVMYCFKYDILISSDLIKTLHKSSKKNCLVSTVFFGKYHLCTLTLYANAINFLSAQKSVAKEVKQEK